MSSKSHRGNVKANDITVVASQEPLQSKGDVGCSEAAIMSSKPQRGNVRANDVTAVASPEPSRDSFSSC